MIGDGKPLFERPDFRGDEPPADLDLDVSGVKRLTLEVDFGEGQDVGDRVVWANPRLLRASRRAESDRVACRVRMSNCKYEAPREQGYLPMLVRRLFGE